MKYEPLTTPEAVLEAIAAGHPIEFTACGCDYQAQDEAHGWITPFGDRTCEDGVRKAFSLDGRRYRRQVEAA
jgi:hypothetical protein